MTYRARLTTWQRALESAQDLASRPADAAELRIATERLAIAVAEAFAARPHVDPALVAAMQRALATLNVRLSERVVANMSPMTSPPPPVAPAPRTWPREAQLARVVAKMSVAGFAEARDVLRRAAAGIALPHEQVRAAFVAVDKPLRSARWAYELAAALPDEAPPEIEARLAPEWAGIERALHETEVAREIVAMRATPVRDPYPTAERTVAERLATLRATALEKLRPEAMKRALQTKRWIQLRAVQGELALAPLDIARPRLVQLLTNVVLGKESPERRELAELLTLVEPAALRAREALERARRNPEPTPPAIEAAIAPLWQEVAEQIEDTQRAVIVARQWLGSP